MSDSLTHYRCKGYDYEFYYEEDNIKTSFKVICIRNTNELKARRFSNLYDTILENRLIVKNLKLTFWISKIPFGLDPIYKVPSSEEIILNNDTIDK